MTDRFLERFETVCDIAASMIYHEFKFATQIVLTEHDIGTIERSLEKLREKIRPSILNLPSYCEPRKDEDFKEDIDDEIVEPKKKINVKKTKEKVEEKKTEKSRKRGTGAKCVHIFSERASRSGEVCGKNVTQEGETLCSTHLKGNKKTVVKEPVVGKPKKRIVITVNKKLDVLWHSSTGFVFNNKDDRVVISKVVENAIVPLNEDDLPVLDEWGMSHNFEVEEKVEEEKVEEEKVEEEEEFQEEGEEDFEDFDGLEENE